MDSLYITKETDEYVLFSNGVYYDIHNSVLTSTKPLSQHDYFDSMIHSDFKYREVIPQLELPLTHRCNLNCTYCSFRSRMKHRNDLDMEWETIDKILKYYRFYLENNRIHYARVDYGVTGEPYLRENIHEQVTKRIKSIFDDSSVERIWAGPYISNGTLPVEKEMASIFCDVQDVSCDGPKHIHDSMRRYPNGEGSFDRLMEFIDSANNAPEFGTSAVLTAKNPDFVEILSFLFEKGFPSIYMKPVNTRPAVEYGLNTNTIDIFKRGYSQIVSFICSLSNEKCLAYLLTLNKEDFFLRFFYRIKERSFQIYRCGCGKSGLYIDTDGLLYPCAHFMGLKDYAIGNVNDGIDEEKRNIYRKNTVYQRTPCSKCWARYLCGGGCLYQSYMANNTIFKPDDAKCSLIKHLITESIRLYEFLSSNHSEVLNALPSTFYMEKTDVDADHEKEYIPKAQLVVTKELNKTVLNNIKNRKFSLVPYVNPELSFVIKNQMLHIIVENLDASAKTIKLSFFDYECHRFLLNDLYNLKNYRGITEFEIDITNQIVYNIQDNNVVRKIPYLDDIKKIATDLITMCSIKNGIEIIVPIKDLWNRLPEYMGMNITVYYADGGYMPLVVYEPFLSLTAFEDGNYSITNGEFSLDNINSINEYDMFNSIGMMPISRWRTVVPNVC